MVLYPEKCPEILKFSCPGKQIYCGLYKVVSIQASDTVGSFETTLLMIHRKGYVATLMEIY